jgi:aspartate/tyrosine/aromatic aminotransferase
MRDALRANLAAAGSTRDWSHITDQIGMFAYTGLTEPQVLELRSKYHIYLTNNGRVSMAGVTSANAEYLAASIKAVAGCGGPRGSFSAANHIIFGKR